MTLIRHIVMALGAIFLSILLVPIPDREDDFSHVLYDRNGVLLSATIATDEQWRFPLEETLPVQLKECILLFEDEYFLYHPGVNPISILKAFWANAKKGKIVRGGSTISMQVMRMARGNRSRTIYQKAIECLGAFKLELFYSKNEILEMWAAMAPMGGNTVGVSTAAWRYFQRDLDNLSNAEYATLAVLPNSPSQVHLGKNPGKLKARRDFLLTKLFRHHKLDSLEWQLSLEEPIPTEQFNIPFDAYHFLEFNKSQHQDRHIFQSTIDANLQSVVQSHVDAISVVYQADGIKNAAAVVIDNQTNEIVAYVGNSKDHKNLSRYVDCVQAPRSYGSLLKPILYAYALDEGYFMPHEMVKDIPTHISGFSPRNYDKRFRGEAPLDQMVSLSLNVPAVRTLNYVGLHSFHHLLTKDLNLKFIHPKADHHGLSIILGGAEGSLLEMARLYKGLSRNYFQKSHPFNAPKSLRSELKSIPHPFEFDHRSISHTIEAMTSLERPKEEQNFIKYGGAEVAWKTGTSYGHRDAWAVGTTPEYTVAVWVGNEDGEGIYNLVGAQKAAPILFKIFGSLSISSFPNLDEKESLQYCVESGRLAGVNCQRTEGCVFGEAVHSLRQCNQHVVTELENGSRNMDYIQDPVVAHYYEKYHGLIPSYHNHKTSLRSNLSIVYPADQSIIFIPKKIDQTISEIQIIARPASDDDVLFWYMNDRLIGTTTSVHQINLSLPSGQHRIFVVDQNGQEDEVSFTVSQRQV